jgi:hypothetical protein
VAFSWLRSHPRESHALAAPGVEWPGQSTAKRSLAALDEGEEDPQAEIERS